MTLIKTKITDTSVNITKNGVIFLKVQLNEDAPHLWTFLAITEKSRWYLKRCLQTVLTEKEWEALEQKPIFTEKQRVSLAKEISATLLGREIHVITSTSTYRGHEVVQTKWYWPEI